MATLSTTRIALAHLASFGIPITLPDGSLVQGVFDPVGESRGAPWSEVGRTSRQGQHPNPIVYLLDATAATLTTESILTIDGARYRVTAPPASDGSGLTRVELMPERNSDPFSRWQ